MYTSTYLQCTCKYYKYMWIFRHYNTLRDRYCNTLQHTARHSACNVYTCTFLQMNIHITTVDFCSETHTSARSFSLSTYLHVDIRWRNEHACALFLSLSLCIYIHIYIYIPYVYRIFARVHLRVRACACVSVRV